MKIVRFTDIHQHGILVTLSVIIEVHINLPITFARAVLRIEIVTAVAGGRAAGTGTSDPDIAVVEKTQRTVKAQSIRFVIFKGNRYVDGGSIRAG